MRRLNALTDPLRGHPDRRMPIEARYRRRCDMCSFPLFHPYTDTNVWKYTHPDGRIEHIYLCQTHDKDMEQHVRTSPRNTSLEAFA